MNNDFFERDTSVARIGAAETSVKLDDEFFHRDTDVARIPLDDSPDSEVSSTPDLKEAILENARGPKRVQGDSGSVEQHPLKDQIAAERFLQSKKAAQKPGLGIKLTKLSPDGTT